MGYFNGDILIIIGLLISLIAQANINWTYSKYKKIANSKKLTGFDVAKKILDSNGLDDIYITEVKGNLTDAYDSSRKVVRLSTDVFHGSSIASIAVAAHECGHAIQDKENYSFMRLRAKMFPLVNICSYAGYFAILIGALFSLINLIWLGIGMEFAILLFQIVTLPVEFDASNRAKKELVKYNLLTDSEESGVSKVLRAAAFTYVASVLTTLLQILRLILSFNRRD